MTKDQRPVRTLIGRGLRRQCPVCGNSDIWRTYLTIRDECPNCGYVFSRESGYFLGAYALNLIAAEAIAMAVLVVLLVRTDWEWWVVELIVIPLAIALPILFFPFSRSLWMALDLVFHPQSGSRIEGRGAKSEGTEPSPRYLRPTERGEARWGDGRGQGEGRSKSNR